MFAVIHDGITVKDKDGNVYPGFSVNTANEVTNDILIRYEKDGNRHFKCLPILEHGKKYVIETRLFYVVAIFDARLFCFTNGVHYPVNEIKGFAPIPQMIEV